MKRDLQELADQHFDVLIIGGGIHGAATAREMARVGLRTALIEQKDFSHATSANSLKIIHGGLRYLQHLNFRRIRESIKSRREMMLLAPHLVKPLGCIVPTYGHGLKGKEIMFLAVMLNDVLSWDRNYGLNIDNHIPMGLVIPRKKCLHLIPGIRKDGLNGAVLWYDALARNTERLILVFLSDAVEYNACVANYVKATELIIRNDAVTGARVRDFFTKETFDIQAGTVINAAGPWFESILPPSHMKKSKPCGWAKAVDIIVKKSLFGDYAVGIEGSKSYTDKDAIVKRGKRFFFFVPWRGYTMIGTTYKPYHGTPDKLEIQVQDIEELIRETNTIYPAAQITLDDVTFFHGGILPMTSPTHSNNAHVQLEKHSFILDHRRLHGTNGLLSIRGVKYTTAPHIATRVRNIIIDRKHVSISDKTNHNRSSYTYDALSLGDPIKQTSKNNNKFDVIEHLKVNYGQHYGKLLEHIQEGKHFASLISKDPPVTFAEVIYAIREEMALKLSDIVFRRTELGTAECPSKQILHNIADIAAQELGWDENQKSQEIREVLDSYYPLMTGEKKQYEAR